jgi:serine/threonine protein kinase
MGTVYRALDPTIDRIVAIKTVSVLTAGSAEEQPYRERFFREAQAAGRLSHPGLVTIHDVGEDGATKTPFIVMEYVEGQTLQALLESAAGKQVTLEHRLDLVQQIAEALDYAHEQGVIHRDIKPANILVNSQGRAKITDFGVAKQLRTEFTVAGQVLGTPAYMSPEQLSGSALDGRSDLFSLGVILYWMLTGAKPFVGDTATTIAFNLVYKDPVPATQLNSSLPPEVNGVLSRALAKDPAKRYQRGNELAQDLEDLREGRKLVFARAATSQPEHQKTVMQRAFGPMPAEPPGSSSSSSIAPGDVWRHLYGEAIVRVRTLPRLVLSLLKNPQRSVEHGTEWLKSLLQAIRKAWAVFWHLPLKARLAVGTTIVLLMTFSVNWALKGTLIVKGRHPFRSADLSISVDDKLIYTSKLSGTERTTLGFFRRVQGSISETVRLPAGKHRIQVRVRAPDEGYDVAEEIQGEFALREQRALLIRFSRGRQLYLQWQKVDTVAAGTAETHPSHSSPLILTVIGSAVSALFGWLIPAIHRGVQRQQARMQDSRQLQSKAQSEV